MKILRKTIMAASFLLYLTGSILSISGAEEDADVYVIELHGEVNGAMVTYLERELENAQKNNQPAVIDIDTWGGLVASASEISNMLLNTPVETTAYVSGKAISAGVLLTISCDNVAMAPSSYIGAAETIPNTEKALSTWKGMLSTAAIERGRPEEVILAMADIRIIIDNYSDEGELLTLAARQAVDLGVSDALCSNVSEVLEYFNLGETYSTAPYTTSDRAASALTSTTALEIFFILGFTFMIIEIFTAGFGVAGIISIICFVMYFFGGAIAGTAQWWAIGLFVLGIIALAIEIFVPGFGVFGITGIIMCTLALIFSANSFQHFAEMAGITLLVCAVLIPILIKIFGKIKLFDRIANKNVQSVSEGYIINQVKDEIIGAVAIAVTELRPTGIIEVDGNRMDALSEEGFIEKGVSVVVSGKRSSSVIVRKQRT